MLGKAHAWGLTGVARKIRLLKEKRRTAFDRQRPRAAIALVRVNRCGTCASSAGHRVTTGRGAEYALGAHRLVAKNGVESLR